MNDQHIYINLQIFILKTLHDIFFQNPIERIEYYMAHRNQREQQILETLKLHMDKQMNEMDLVKMIYTETPEHLWAAAAYNVNHHLVKLTKENKIKCINSDGENRWQYVNSRSSL